MSSWRDRSRTIFTMNITRKTTLLPPFFNKWGSQGWYFFLKRDTVLVVKIIWILNNLVIFHGHLPMFWEALYLSYGGLTFTALTVWYQWQWIVTPSSEHHPDLPLQPSSQRRQSDPGLLCYRPVLDGFKLAPRQRNFLFLCLCRENVNPYLYIRQGFNSMAKTCSEMRGRHSPKDIRSHMLALKFLS